MPHERAIEFLPFRREVDALPPAPRGRSAADLAGQVERDDEAVDDERLDEREADDHRHEDLAVRLRVARDAVEAGGGGAALAERAAEGGDADRQRGADA